MLRGLFASNRPTVLLALLPPALVVAVLAFFFAGPAPAVLAGPAYDLLFAPVNHYPAVSVALGMFVIVAGALLVNGIYNEHEFAEKVNFLPALVYFAFASSSFSWVYFNPLLLANVFLLLSLRRLFRIYRIPRATSMLYDAGLYMALAVVVYPPFACCVPFLWVGMTQLRSSTFREWLVPLAGLATVAIYVVVGYWWYGFSPGIEEFLAFAPRFSPGALGFGGADHGYVWFLVLTVGLYLFGLALFAGGMARATVHRKNTKRAFLWLSVFLIGGFVYMGLLQRADAAGIAILLVPVAVFVARAFVWEQRRWLVNVLFYGWLALVVLRMVYPAVP